MMQVANSNVNKGKSWPDSLRAWVERAFSLKTTDAERTILNVSPASDPAL